MSYVATKGNVRELAIRISRIVMALIGNKVISMAIQQFGNIDLKRMKSAEINFTNKIF